MTRPLHVVVVEDNDINQKNMRKYLEKIFQCQVTTLSHGIEAINYLTDATSQFDLVILDGKLNSLHPIYKSIPIDGPDVASAMKEKGVKVNTVLWTNDPNMLARFDEIFDKRLPEIEKPGCRESNIAAVLTPIIEAIRTGKNLDLEQEQTSSPDFSP